MSDEREKLKQAVSNAKHSAGQRLSDLWWWLLIRGALACILGGLALFWPKQTVGLLVNLLGAYLIFDGLVGIVGAFRSGGRGTATMVSTVGLVVGAVLIFWTGPSIKIFLILVGAWAIIQGCGILIASRSRESHEDARALVSYVGIGLVVAGLAFIFWPTTGVTAVSWLIAIILILIGCLLLFVGNKLRLISKRLKAAN